MSQEGVQAGDNVIDFEKPKQFEAQSAFASTLLTDAEKAHPSQIAGQGKARGNLYGSTVDTAITQAGVDPVYTAKAQLLNVAMLDMGMGAYQWLLFLTTSMGWFLDYFWMASFVIIAPSASNEAQFFYTYNKEAFLFISQFVGLTAGALVWPIMSDRMGRQWIFTSTLALMGMGGLVGAGMPAFTGLCVVGFVVGLAVAGNQSLDAIVLIESLPASHQYLVAFQGVFWGLGELVAYAVGWAFVAEYTCGTGPDAVSTASTFSHSKRASSASSCHYVSNKGWRYVWWTFGCITIFLYLCRFAFSMLETPKFLLANRRDAEATQTVKDIAAFNKRSTWLTEASFARIDSSMMESKTQPKTGAFSSFKSYGFVLLTLLWAITGLTFPLHNTYIKTYLSTKGVAEVTASTVTSDYLYSRYLYISLCAIPGPLIAGFLIEAKGLGRKRAGAIIALLTGIFMLISAVSESRDAWLAFECVISCLQFSGLAIITTYTVEVFAAPVRGAAVGVTGFFWRLFALVAMIVTTFAGGDASGGAAIWFCGAVWIVMAGVWLALPTETRAKAAL